MICQYLLSMRMKSVVLKRGTMFKLNHMDFLLLGALSIELLTLKSER
jgi:hypothetical protein